MVGWEFVEESDCAVVEGLVVCVVVDREGPVVVDATFVVAVLDLPPVVTKERSVSPGRFVWALVRLARRVRAARGRTMWRRRNGRIRMLVWSYLNCKESR